MHLFNPENDLALANFSCNYTPPASAVRMGEELALLPVWYADGKGARVIAEGGENLAFLNNAKGLYDLKASMVSVSTISLYPRDEIFPWGWSPSLVRRLRVFGASDDQLPSLGELERLRGYSSRIHAVEILAELRGLNEHFIGDSLFFTVAEDLLAYLGSIPGDKALKMPLSGSGKGLVWVLRSITDKQVDWCRRVIREQGGVVAEPRYDRVKDFAMEFYLDHGKVRFAGYSLFRTAASGAYMGNELLDDSKIEEVLSSYVPLFVLDGLREQLLKVLPFRFPHYKGYAGVDMMVCDTPDGHRVHPCVEINMRMNMGVVSRIIHERHARPGAEGRFMVDYFKKPGAALLFHQKMEREHPLIVENNKVASGCLPLTPVTAETRYTAYVVIDP